MPTAIYISHYIASSQRSSPQAISHGFPSVHPVVASISLVFRHNWMDEHVSCRSLPKKLRMSHRPVFAHRLTSLGRIVFRHNRIDVICPEKPVLTAIHSYYTVSFLRISPEAISHGFPSIHLVIASISLLSHEFLPISYCPRLPLSSSCRRFHAAPSPRSSPQAISNASPPSTLSSLPYRFPPTELNPCYFPRFPLRPP